MKTGQGHSSWNADEDPDQKMNEGPRASQHSSIRHAPQNTRSFSLFCLGGRIFLQRGPGD